MIIDVTPKSRMERVEGNIRRHTLRDGQPTWCVYERVPTNGIHPVLRTYTSFADIWVKRGELMTEAEARELCLSLGK